MTDREELILKSILRCLKEAGEYMTRGDHLKDAVGVRVPRMARSEFFSVLDAAEDKALVTAAQGTRGLEYKINTAGEAFLIENR